MAAFQQPRQSFHYHRSRPSNGSLKSIITNKNMADRAGSSSSEFAGGRTSFSSIREQTVSGLAQTFTQSRISSLAGRRGGAVSPTSPTDETAVFDDGASYEDLDDDGDFVPPLTKPASRLNAVWYPSVAGLRGWKKISLRGKLASRSFEDLRQAGLGVWDDPADAWDCNGDSADVQTQAEAQDAVAGLAPFERLPAEILASIIGLLFIELPNPSNTLMSRNKDLISLLLTSRTIYQSTLGILYHHVTIPRSPVFRKFLNTISTYPALGAKVRRLDFSHFKPDFTVSHNQRHSVRNLTPETLARSLELMPFLREFLVQEHVDTEVSADVLNKLFFELPRMQALDFAGCSSALFKDAFVSLLPHAWPAELTIRRLSLHRCMTLPSSVLETILPRLARLTHLDVAATRITNAALESIPHTARITHLNLARCSLLSASTVINFVQNHPAAKELVFLSLSTNAVNNQLLSADDVSALLPILPLTLRSLSLKGSSMDAAHIPLLQPLTLQLEELAIGRLSVAHLQPLLAHEGHTIRYLDLTDLNEQELSLSTIFNDRNSLLNAGRRPLEVIEFSELAHKRLARSQNALTMTGWVAKEIQSRCWIVSLHSSDGHRAWKMGAKDWGMRKLPMAVAEVGGMFGTYMFGNKL